MINNVISFPQLPDVAQIKPTPILAPAVTATNASGDAPPQDEKSELGQDKGRDQEPPLAYTLRLTIDKDPTTGEWIYRAIDRYTGKIVSQMPHQTVKELISSMYYQVGSVIKTDI
ncbi:flagellar biosynthesis protein FlaG [Asticcacaulis sp. EMRT-3]|uniref:flagellar biosynthesis protein FlaG n=1 Tax=Asticcacaulis sp. EMRT-3 TaxID=3040349 RepID=UPI0024AF9A38|nr:flagellar biosynthesis protein FlaG [Asticcacaulis sp. EMRT-3]MDI7774338.1 flagellar biosynthesis protein FlaG [Asticcacaulis sp. EMRT-3]